MRAFQIRNVSSRPLELRITCEVKGAEVRVYHQTRKRKDTAPLSPKALAASGLELADQASASLVPMLLSRVMKDAGWMREADASRMRHGCMSRKRHEYLRQQVWM